MKTMTAFELYKKPEFKAFCDVLGIPWEANTTYLNIEIDVNDIVKITHKYNAKDTPCDKPVETTNLHNQQYKTFQPKGNE